MTASEILKKCGFESPAEVRRCMGRVTGNYLTREESARLKYFLEGGRAYRNERRYSHVPLRSDGYFRCKSQDNDTVRYVLLGLK